MRPASRSTLRVAVALLPSDSTRSHPSVDAKSKKMAVSLLDSIVVGRLRC